jgi:peptidoglycan/xylan/chitin deacetylase (PgdA/CDA1 family)
VTVAVLLYHGIGDDAGPAHRQWAMPVATFRSHLAALADAGATFVPLSDVVAALAHGRPLPPQAVVLTFDDGFAGSCAEIGRLAADGIPTTLYVTTGWIGRPATAGWADLAALPPGTVGAHGVTHRRLDELAGPEVWAEVSGAKSTIEDRVGHPCVTFAYPHGNLSPLVRAAVVKAGYTSAAAVRNALSHAGDDRFAIARLTVTEDMPLSRLVDATAGRGTPVAPDGERMRTRIYRTYRRSRARIRPPATVEAP